MDIIKELNKKVAMVVFCDDPSSDLGFLKNVHQSYSYNIDIDEPLEEGDFVVVESKNKLSIGVFLGFSRDKEKIKIATKSIVAKVKSYKVKNKGVKRKP